MRGDETRLEERRGRRDEEGEGDETRREEGG